MLTLHNVPSVKRMAQSLHSTGFLMGPSHHFDDAALPQHKICFRQACPWQLFLSCMILQHVFAAMVSISQRVKEGLEGAQRAYSRCP